VGTTIASGLLIGVADSQSHSTGVAATPFSSESTTNDRTGPSNARSDAASPVNLWCRAVHTQRQHE
jgi:hypothetical protein